MAARYDERLEALDWLVTPHVPDGYVHSYQAYVCLSRPEEPTVENVPTLHERRNELMRDLERHGIATRRGTHAAALTSYYATKYGIRPDDFPNGYAADRLTLALPLYLQLMDEERELVSSELANASVGV